MGNDKKTPVSSIQSYCLKAGAESTLHNEPNLGGMQNFRGSANKIETQTHAHGTVWNIVQKRARVGGLVWFANTML